MPHIGNFPAVGYPKPLVLGGACFVPMQETYDWMITGSQVYNRASLNVQYFQNSFILPQGARIDKVTLHAYRDDALAPMNVRLFRYDRQAGGVVMCELVPDWTDGEGSVEQTTIDYNVIDNENFAYGVQFTLNPNDSVNDIKFRALKIAWT